MQAGVCKGHPAACFVYRHTHSSKLRTSLLYRAASSHLRYDKLKLQPPHGPLQVSSSTEEVTQQNDPGTKTVKVKFILRRRCEFGQQFCVIGDEQLFGAWDPEAAIRMQWAEGHIWTVELDLSVRTYMEFKVIRMAEQELLEWQPGPNCKLELSEASLSLVVFVPWSDQEENLEKDPQVSVVINEASRTQDDTTEEQTIEETSTNSGMVKANAKDILDERHTEAKEIVTADQEAIDTVTSLNSGLKYSKVTSSFAIPESWYGEESKQMNELSSSHDSMQSSIVSLEDIAEGETMSLGFNFSSSDKEEGNRKKLVTLNMPDEVEGQASSTIISNELEPIAEDDNDEPRVSDVPVEANPQRNVGTLLSDTMLKDASEESSEKHAVQNGSTETISETRSEVEISTTVSNNQDQIDMEVQVDIGPSVPTVEVPEIENPVLAADSLQNVDTEPSIKPHEKKQGRKGWSKLWRALVAGRFD